MLSKEKQQEIIQICNQNEGITYAYFEQDDDLVITVINNRDVYKYIVELVSFIEYKYNINLHILYEQIQDRINDGNEEIEIDVYIW